MSTMQSNYTKNSESATTVQLKTPLRMKTPIKEPDLNTDDIVASYLKKKQQEKDRLNQKEKYMKFEINLNQDECEPTPKKIILPLPTIDLE